MSRYWVNHEIEVLIITSDSLEEYNCKMELLDDMTETSERLFDIYHTYGYVVFQGIREDYKS